MMSIDPAVYWDEMEDIRHEWLRDQGTASPFPSQIRQLTTDQLWPSCKSAVNETTRTTLSST
jgi:hypothetical protein